MNKSIVLLSGGMDSATALSIAKRKSLSCYALTINYGQKHSNEIEKAKLIANHFQVIDHKIIDIDLTVFGGSALTDKSIDIPENESQGIPVTYVPARNTIFFSLALAWAEVIGANSIYSGVNAIDYSGYPDCRPEYIEAMQEDAPMPPSVMSTGGYGDLSFEYNAAGSTPSPSTVRYVEAIKKPRTIGKNLAGPSIELTSELSNLLVDFETYFSSLFTTNLAKIPLKNRKKKIDKILNKATVDSIGDSEVIKKFTGLTLNIEATKNGDLHNEICLFYNNEYSELIREKWYTPLNSSIHMSPQIIYNHHNDQIVLFQDDENNLIAFNKDGDRIWKKHIEKNILGEINSIDFYNNQKHQAIFNTEDKLYLIDRNGDFVDGFPKNLPTITSMGHSLFDYNEVTEKTTGSK